MSLCINLQLELELGIAAGMLVLFDCSSHKNDVSVEGLSFSSDLYLTSVWLDRIFIGFTFIASLV